MIVRDFFGGDFGNKILQFNNLVQLANQLNTNYQSIKWEGCQYFTDLKINQITASNNSITLDSNTLKTITTQELNEKYRNKNIKLIGPLLGELFFKYTIINPAEIFKLKPEYILTINEETTNIAIHIRDFGSWNKPNELTDKYYINAINFCLNQPNSHVWSKPVKFFLFTNQVNYIYYKRILEYLQGQKINFELGEATKKNSEYIYDFGQISQCDVIIASLSTYCICASLLGKSNKQMIYNQEWIENCLKKNDKFWCDLYHGGNQYHRIWKLISMENTII